MPRLADVTHGDCWPPLRAEPNVTLFDEVVDGGGQRPCDILIRCGSEQPTPDLDCVAEALSQVLRSGSMTMLETMLCDLDWLPGSGPPRRWRRRATGR